MPASPLDALLLGPIAKAVASGPRQLDVLILDDDATDRLRVIRTLRGAGLRARTTEIADVPDFFPALDGKRFDIVFVDYFLGFESGLDALALLAAHPDQPRAVPIMLSRATEPGVIVEAMRAGCADYLVKDALAPDTLRACITAALERRILLAAARESVELRHAIRRLVDRLASGAVPGMGEPGASDRGV
ncbi:MAG: response regulator, partial [Pseudomonadota bacterium]